MTMKALAEQIGVSESLISQIERDRVSPSLDTLISMVEVLEIDVEYLFNELKRTKEVTLVKREKRNSHLIEGVKYEQLSRITDYRLDHHIEAVKLEVPPGRIKSSSEYGHLGRELGFVLHGRGLFAYGTEAYELEEGDSISFASDIPHSLSNTGDTPLRAMWIMTPPRMFLPRGNGTSRREEGPPQGK
jgi:transcriptional regulator with XRE-family HTH domain